ncbi:TPA: CBS domain-containing protein [Legionella pneumophila]|uniref:Magnesium and cobalt efflux protein CorC n=2 Tax=Legionella pneumophila TaxID=446 RepID=Q5ZVK1_LEGPH|nr:transporter associated domain-containing protein [Legionella pneumophila]WBV64482.1 CBS domain-containing protein [Legionella pneumophila 130b]AAU27521.1 Mg2+ and Co2+ transporter CorC [Legionella pneumophila subsp. pneumophila str. Philadelphia 1]AGN14330.1 magnesium and cobalt transporter [Legionella pneumophila subsp. pneumophila str. Thunder Bay]AOU04450.1 magnesium/cobalt efflux protein [Legionella pneumophila]AOU07414.1 magnesium/cobalt efflux protein [Legionella pneumophila]
MLIHMKSRKMNLNKLEDGGSWFSRLKQFLQGEPQNQEELVSLLRDAQIRSLINSETLAMIEGAILFSKMRVRDIMLPKNQMVCINKDDDFKHIISIVTQTGHSRFPVTGENSDEVVGILHAKDLLKYQPENMESFDLLDICRQVTFVPESRRLDSLLSEFRSNRNHMAIVVDEYGEVSGFVTIEDIIEQIIGDIEDEFDIDEDAYIKTHEGHCYIIKAHTPIEEFNEQLNADFSDETYDTIGGIVLNKFGYLPQRGEVIIIDDFEFKVLNADSRRIKLLECLDKRSPEKLNSTVEG